MFRIGLVHYACCFWIVFLQVVLPCWWLQMISSWRFLLLWCGVLLLLWLWLNLWQMKALCWLALVLFGLESWFRSALVSILLFWGFWNLLWNISWTTIWLRLQILFNNLDILPLFREVLKVLPNKQLTFDSCLLRCNRRIGTFMIELVQIGWIL